MLTRHVIVMDQWFKDRGKSESREAAARIFSYPTQGGFDDAKDTFGGARQVVAVQTESDLAVLSIADLIVCINLLRQEKPIKALNCRPVGMKRLWALLTTRKDTADEGPATSSEPLAPLSLSDTFQSSRGRDEKVLADASSSGYEMSTDADASQTNDGEDPMTSKPKKAAKKAPKAKAAAPKTPKAPAAAKATIPLDDFGLRATSKASAAAKLMAREKGSTMAEMIEKTGDTQYNLINKLKENFKVTKDKASGTYFLKAK